MTKQTNLTQAVLIKKNGKYFGLADTPEDAELMTHKDYVEVEGSPKDRCVQYAQESIDLGALLADLPIEMLKAEIDRRNV